MEIILQFSQLIIVRTAWFFLIGIAAVTLIQLYWWRRDIANARRLRKKYLVEKVFDTTPFVSVLVPAWNEARLIEQHILAFLRLRYPNKELILCAGGQDGTYEIANRYAGEQVLVIKQQPGDGKQRALRRCLLASSGDIIFLADADGLLNNSSFERTLAPLIGDGAQAASGITCPLAEQMNNPFVLYQWCAELYSTAAIGNYVPSLRGCNSAIYRIVLNTVGGFAENVAIGTDDHLAIRLREKGVKIRFVRDSQVPNEFPEDLHSYIRQQSRWLRVALLRSLEQRDKKAVQLGMDYSFYILPPLLLLLSPMFGVSFAYFALLSIFYMLCTRIRIVSFGQTFQNISFPWQSYLQLVLYLIYDIFIRVVSLIQLLLPTFRKQW